MVRVNLDTEVYELAEDELALVENALVCYAEQLRVSEGEARIAMANIAVPIRKGEVNSAWACLNQLAETHAETGRRVKRLLEKIG